MKVLKNNNEQLTAYKHLESKYKGPFGLLSIQPNETFITSKNAEGSTYAISLNIGTQSIGNLFKHEPPTPEEIEAGINIIEDELMQAVPYLQTTKQLISSQPLIKAIITLADAPGINGELSREELERTFSRFAVISMGRSPQSDVVPTDAAFAANFLILREIMHHLKVESIRLA